MYEKTLKCWKKQTVICTCIMAISNTFLRKTKDIEAFDSLKKSDTTLISCLYPLAYDWVQVT